jgi:hypothetical protein
MDFVIGNLIGGFLSLLLLAPPLIIVYLIMHSKEDKNGDELSG